MRKRAARPASEATIKALVAIGKQPWRRHTFDPQHMSYQSCRFCRRHVLDCGGLWHYAVRHYACDECRERIITYA
jgi:hypothetical protein